MRYFVLTTIAIAACGHPAPAQPDTTPPAFPYAYAEAADRLEALADQGLVVTRDQDGGVQHAGDRLVFTGMAMAALDCARGAAQDAALVAQYADGNVPADWDLDSELGLDYGVAGRIIRCGGAGDWPTVWPAHAAAVKSRLPMHFAVVVDQVNHLLGNAPEPSETDRGHLGSDIAGWAGAVVLARDAAFRLHLGYLALSVVPAPRGKAAFCSVVKSAHMPLIEHFCGRGSLSDWAAGFVYDRAEYILQRASWESETNPAGWHTPALDYLVALRELGAAEGK